MGEQNRGSLEFALKAVSILICTLNIVCIATKICTIKQYSFSETFRFYPTVWKRKFPLTGELWCNSNGLLEEGSLSSQEKGPKIPL